jgi:hypothetical protein
MKTRRGNREAKKPKQSKPKAASTAKPFNPPMPSQNSVATARRK